MSYILEALKKSERERQQAHTPTLPDLVVEGPTGKRGTGRWIALALLLLGGNAALMAYLWTTHHGERPPEPAQKTVVPAPPAPTAVPAVSVPPVDGEKEALSRKLQELENRVAKIATPQAPAPLPQEAAAKEDKPKAPNPATALPLAPQGARKTTATPVPAAKAASSRATEPFRRGAAAIHVPEEGAAEEPTDSLPVEPYPQPPPELPDEHLRSAAELPPSTRQKLPPLKINLLAYSSSPEERFAVVDMVRYGLGARLPGGAVLVDIVPDGLVLELDGEKFKVRHR